MARTCSLLVVAQRLAERDVDRVAAQRRLVGRDQPVLEREQVLEHAPRRSAPPSERPRHERALSGGQPLEHAHGRQVRALVGADLRRRAAQRAGRAARRAPRGMRAPGAAPGPRRRRSASPGSRRRGNVRAYSSALRPEGGSPPRSRISSWSRVTCSRSCSAMARVLRSASPLSTSSQAAYAATTACSSASSEPSRAAPDPGFGPPPGGGSSPPPQEARTSAAAAPPSASRRVMEGAIGRRLAFTP